MFRDRLIAVGGGLLCAVLHLSVRSGSPGAILLSYLSQLPLFLVGFSIGWRNAAIAVVVALAGILAGTSPTAAGLFAAFNAAPVLIVVYQGLLSRPGPRAGTLAWYPPGLLLAWLTAYGLVLFAIAAVVLLGTHGGFENAARALVDSMTASVRPGSIDPTVKESLEAVARYLPAALLSVWLIMVMVNAVLAQGILSQTGRSLRPSPRFRELELPRWMAVGLAIAVVASALPGGIGTTAQNAAIMLSVPYFFLGLAVIHAVSYRVRSRNAVLVAVYIVLIMLFIWSAIAIVGLGLAEQWARLRQRYAPPDQDQENE